MRGVMAPCRSKGVLLAVLSLVALSYAGPLGPLPNATGSDDGLKEGSCVVGDVVYMPGDTFTGATPCERCACAAGNVTCAQERCEPRAGCKALHRPDHCCPTYQCECEQEGRVYGNGEKLVDPEDPCRVCYCQGGEVVCRRIACFLRDDCQPRLVKGRCCPEYDNCPLRGVTAIPGLVPPVSSIATTENLISSALTPPKENIKQEITIKEITPVSEIPVITDVKIKEILPSPSIEVPEYPSSKSPLIPREAIPDKTVTSSVEISPKTEESVVIELISPLPTGQFSKPAQSNPEIKSATGLLPSKISLSTQDSINSEIYPSHIPTIIATMGVPPLTPDSIRVASTTRVAIIEEEDTSLFDHNPAFPPIPDDLSEIGAHEDEIVSEQNADIDHIMNVHGEEHVASTPPPTESPVPKEISTTTVRNVIETTITTTTTTEKNIEAVSITTLRTTEDIDTSTAYVSTSTKLQSDISKSSSMLDLRSAIPTNILNMPSSVEEDINGELDDPSESVTAFEEPLDIASPTTPEPVVKLLDESTIAPQLLSKNKILPRSSEVTNTPFDTTTRTTHGVTDAPEIITAAPKASESGTESTETPTSTTTAPQRVTEATESLTSTTTAPQRVTAAIESLTTTTTAPLIVTDALELLTSTTKVPEELTTSSVSKSNIATELTSQTDFSSLSIETSDQKPHDSSEIALKEVTSSTMEPDIIIEITTAQAKLEPKEVATTEATPPPQTSSTLEMHSFENVETTEFIITSFGSSESTTDTLEFIKISPTQTERNAAIIDSSHGKKTNFLTDLKTLVGDVASISDHTDAPEATLRTTTSNSISDSEELMPVNAGYKSKNSNFNLNSITEIPLKTKNQLPINKQKVVEIEGEDTDSIADSLPPHDKVEPTTRRPIIDNVSDTMSKNETDKKDIEIISQSYVPTINRRPTKVVMKKNNDKPLSEATTEGLPLATVSPDEVTSSPDDVTASPVIVTVSTLSADDSSTTIMSAAGADATTTPAPAQ